MVILEEPSMPSLVTDTSQQDIVVDTAAVDLEDSEDTEESWERAITENNLATRAFTPVEILMVVLLAATVSKAFSANSTAEATASATATAAGEA